ncbi:uncharacterized protein LOC121991967 isoform X2 [Zingiber officinale]|uniref:uncharacterized protein LOC121991967 isoform X2 n=1 Tax=Zingiber officinale TaxID=94328 RepID=UPI001C4B7BCC|nr:uncharacterized protein LOC121991967 isoform X2 [Zingiber officinale]
MTDPTLTPVLLMSGIGAPPSFALWSTVIITQRAGPIHFEYFMFCCCYSTVTSEEAYSGHSSSRAAAGGGQAWRFLLNLLLKIFSFPAHKCLETRLVFLSKQR